MPIVISKWLVGIVGVISLGIGIGIQYSTLENVPKLFPSGTANIELSGVRVRNVAMDQTVVSMNALSAQLFLNQPSRIIMHTVQGAVDAYSLRANHLEYILESGQIFAYNQVQLLSHDMRIITDHLHLDIEQKVLKLLRNNRVVFQQETPRRPQ
ncbi:hypothetical protein CL648_00820 [bacterium]|nr:hypothetical protein [bacterium]|tara:strand:+ start:344 stop:805 length:462 start_codon:yes stop_codon:yes gene_type:complete